MVSTDGNHVNDGGFVRHMCAPLPKVSAALQSRLAADITTAEVLAAIKAGGKNRSPSSTGVVTEFYQAVAAEIALQLAAQFNYARKMGRLSDLQCLGVMSLLYKHKGSPVDPKNLRPLSLLQRDRCIFATVLVRRVRNIIRSVIDLHQSAFTIRDIQTHVLSLHDAAAHARRSGQH